MRAIPAFACVPEGSIDPDNLPYDQIWYKTIDDMPFHVDMKGNNVLSHVFQDGWWIITCDAPIKKIPDSAFYGYGLKEIHFPDCVEEIGNSVFYAADITTFRTPAAWKEAGIYLFTYCDKLTSFTGKWASSDGRAVILGDGKMVACIDDSKGGVLQIPSGAKILKEELFASGHLSAREVKIPEGVEIIEPYCFRDNPTLEKVQLPGSLTDVQYNAFARCKGLESFSGDCPLIVDNCALIKRSGEMVAFAGKGKTEYRIPEGVTCIGHLHARPRRACPMGIPIVMTGFGLIDVGIGDDGIA